MRSQLNNLKASSEGEMVRMESRLLLKMDDAFRNTDRYDRIDRKIEDLNSAVSKRLNSYEDDFQKNLNKLSSTIDVGDWLRGRLPEELVVNAVCLNLETG